MNYIKHLTGFFNKAADEKKLNPTHISLYIALFQCWNVNRFKNPTGISREQIMNASKINSNATYHKCMKDLQTLGFIEYLPTYNPHSSSNIIMINFSEDHRTKPKNELLTSSKNEPVQNLALSKINQANEQVNELAYIYNNKQTYLNNLKTNIGTNPIFFENENSILKFEKEKKEKKSSAKKKEQKDSNPNVPTLEETAEYFIFKSSTETEANKFFNYYSSTGWLVGGKTKMRDWKAAARNWIMNQDKFKVKTPQQQQTLQPNNLNVSNNKNYAEPL